MSQSKLSIFCHCNRWQKQTPFITGWHQQNFNLLWSKKFMQIQAGICIDFILPTAVEHVTLHHRTLGFIISISYGHYQSFLNWNHRSCWKITNRLSDFYLGVLLLLLVVFLPLFISVAAFCVRLSSIFFFLLFFLLPDLVSFLSQNFAVNDKFSSNCLRIFHFPLRDLRLSIDFVNFLRLDFIDFFHLSFF